MGPSEVLAEAECVLKLKEDGQFDKVLAVIDYKIIEETDLRPFRTSEIVWSGKTYRLAHEIACGLSKENHLVILQYEPLHIRTYASTRDEAIRDLNEEFAFLWQEFGQAEDSDLSHESLDLKQALRDLVKEVQP